MNPLFIGASWFLTQGYCEYKLYMQKVLRIPLPKTQQMIQGSFIHKQKEEEFLKKAELTSWEDFLKSEELTIAKEVELQKNIGDTKFLGIVDEIAIDKEKIKIIDDKPNAYPYDSTKRQIIAYCYLFKENFQSNKTIIAALRDRDSNEIVWQQEFSKEIEKDFLLSYHRMRRLLLKQDDPIPTKNPNKCKVCQFNKMCGHSLIK